MRISSSDRKESAFTRKRPSRIGRQCLVAFGAIFLCQGSLRAQQASGAPDTDRELVRSLLQRIEQLEGRLRQLEAKTNAAPAPSVATSTPPASATPAPPPEVASGHADHDVMEPSQTRMRIHGYADVNLRGSTLRRDTTSFNLGQLNLFVTSDISEKFKFLGEVIFTAAPDNTYRVSVERLLVQYTKSDYFNLSVGRYHSAIGYYNTAYHHSSWFQTATDRPFIFRFDSAGGILPIHNVGASVSGRIPSGSLGLNYIAEVGNGRTSSNRLASPVQNVVDENNRKSFNLALFAKPDVLSGLRLGFSAYRDVLTPSTGPKIGETILSAHVVYIQTHFEWLNEALVIRHAPIGSSAVFHTPAFYTQISRRFGAYRPYFRYQYVNAPAAEPVFPQVALRHGPSAGVRFDASESVAIKLQYDRTYLRRQSATDGLTLQFAVTF